MNARRMLAIGITVLLLCLGLNLALDRRLSGEQVVAPSAAGRYQFAVKANGTNSVVFVFDPVTADCWYGETVYATKEWTHMGSPLQKPASKPTSKPTSKPAP